MKLYIKRLTNAIDIKFNPEDKGGIFFDDDTCKKLGCDITQLKLTKEKFTEVEVNITINSSVG